MISSKSCTVFQEGDLVTIKTHYLSQTYYGLTRKFFCKYEGLYIVIKRIGSNAYLLRSNELIGEDVLGICLRKDRGDLRAPHIGLGLRWWEELQGTV